MKILNFLLMLFLCLTVIGCKKEDNNNNNKEEPPKPPVEVEKEIQLLKDSHFSQGFDLLGISPVEDGRTIYKHLDFGGEAENDASWVMAQWWTPYNLVDGVYTKEGDKHIYKTQSRTISINPKDNGYLYMELLGSEEYEKPRELGEPWSHALIEQHFETSVKMTELAHLYMSMEVTVHYVTNKTGDAYDPGKHAAQLLWYITLRNVVPEGSNPEEVGTNGDYLWFGVPIYDNRVEFVPESKHIDHGGPGTTNKLIYSMSSRNYFDEPIEMNKTYKINVDILPYVKEAFIYAINNNALVNAQIENMEIGYMNFGWEIPGVFDAAATIRDISIIGVKK